MMLSNTPAMKRLRGDKGFTLVELLVVIVIIGILVAIAVPIFLNQREAAQKRAVESDVRNAIPVMETYYAEHGDYDGVMEDFADNKISGDETAPFAVSKDVTLEINADAQSYVITGTHAALDGEGSVAYDSAEGGSVQWAEDAADGE